jgi:hypothetical protein
MDSKSKQGGTKMKKMRKAVGYVCSVPVTGGELMVSKEDQRLRILKYAEKENLELVSIFEDDNFSENCAARSGVTKLLTCPDAYETVVVERVWAFSKKLKELEPVLSKLEARKVGLVCTSFLWDMVSQQVRSRFGENLAEKMQEAAKAGVEAKHGKRAA